MKDQPKQSQLRVIVTVLEKAPANEVRAREQIHDILERRKQPFKKQETEALVGTDGEREWIEKVYSATVAGRKCRADFPNQFDE